jgi:hypothetical protein
MKPIRLEDLIPQAASFTLKKTGNTYHLRPINLQDEIWLKKAFGDQIDVIFREVRMPEICRLVFHQLEDADKEEFLAKNVTIINEEGEKLTVRMGGAELLFASISGHAEKIKIFEAILQTIGVSRPMLEDASASTPASNSDVALEKKTEEKI